MNTEKIQLDYPVDSDGVKTDTLTMRRAKVKDQVATDRIGGSDAEKEVRLFANLCEVAPATIEDLDMSDYKKLQEVYTGFLAPKPKP